MVKGIYRHYKGKRYEVVAIAHHAETLEELVVYRALYCSKEFGDRAWWVRSKKMFLETVETEVGKTVERFVYEGPAGLDEADKQGNTCNS